MNINDKQKCVYVMHKSYTEKSGNGFNVVNEAFIQYINAICTK